MARSKLCAGGQTSSPWHLVRVVQITRQDRASADEILETLQLLNRELGKTIVMVTHDPSAAKYAARELHLDKGRFIEAKAEPAQ